MSKIIEPITELVEISRCTCGDPICTKFVISSGYGGRFNLADARLYQHAPRMLQELKDVMRRNAAGAIVAGALPDFWTASLRQLVAAVESTDLDH